ncbi:C2H2-like zinc finger protein [Perilla frutescens var. hirtella]|nr:C2H2-like zinc finger protein [Perilla frutescens var. frutescens]KAH6784605.1 C2H2-like zinc finger protein [Perilla frutescens var. hirtella]
MSNSGAAGNQGSPSSNPNSPPPTEVIPRRREDAPRGLGSSPRRPPTADSRPPAPQWASPGTSLGPSGSGGFGFGLLGAHGVPVGGSGGGVAAAGALGIGGSPPGRKRVREAGGGDQPGEGGANEHPCSVCGKSYGSLKALFGHMRKHPDRGWKGVHPPPAFRAEEEFADLRAQAADAQDEGTESDYRVPDLNQPPPPDT